MDAVRELLDDLSRAPGPDVDAVDAVSGRAANVLRPAGALARLDALAVWLAAWQATATPSAEQVAAIVFVGEHGVCEDGVSAYPSGVTAAMDAALRDGVATAAAWSRVLGARLDVVDVGVGHPTANLRTHDAMDHDRFAAALQAGREAVTTALAHGPLDVLVVGEMGIGNTTASAAVAAGLEPLLTPGGPSTDGAEPDGSALDGEAQDGAAQDGAAADPLALAGPASEPVARAHRWVGRGTGVDDEGLQRKQAVVATALSRLDEPVDGAPAATGAVKDDRAAAAAAFEVLRRVGGTELAAMCGAVAEARMRGVPVLLDGFVCTAAVAPLATVAGGLDHCRAGHVSAEGGHRRLLGLLGLEPLLDLGLRLGEGSGALAAVPLLRLAVTGVLDVATFAEAGLA